MAANATFTLWYGKIEISCECEKCGDAFDTARVLESTVSNTTGNAFGSQILAEHISEKLEAFEKERTAIFSSFESGKMTQSITC
jgi:hypothetical protein